MLVHDNYIPQSHPLTITRFTADGLFPTVAAPQFSQFGGEVDEGFGLTMSTTSGGATIWYTTNGAGSAAAGRRGEQRLRHGLSAATCRSTATTTVKARTRRRQHLECADRSDVCRIAGGRRNRHQRDQLPPARCDRGRGGSRARRHGGRFRVHRNPQHASHRHDQPDEHVAGQRVDFHVRQCEPRTRAVRRWSSRTSTAFQARYGTGHNILGQWSGGLSNSGETIELRDALGGLMMAVSYTDVDPWSEAADGDGPTLELIDPAGGSEAANWRASFYAGGSPGSERQTLSGDYNRDRVVDDADYLAWRASFSRSVESEIGADGNGDGAVDAADYAVWRTNLGSTAMASGAALHQLLSVESVAPDHEPQSRLTSATSDLVFELPEIARPEGTAIPKRPLFRLLTDSAELGEEQLRAVLASRSRLSARSNDPFSTIDRSTTETSATQDTFDSFEEDGSTDALDRALELLTAN